MLEQTDAIMNEVPEPITFIPAYPTVFHYIQRCQVVFIVKRF